MSEAETHLQEGRGAGVAPYTHSGTRVCILKSGLTVFHPSEDTHAWNQSMSHSNGMSSAGGL